jgi:hypothetical protein
LTIYKEIEILEGEYENSGGAIREVYIYLWNILSSQDKLGLLNISISF